MLSTSSTLPAFLSRLGYVRTELYNLSHNCSRFSIATESLHTQQTTRRSGFDVVLLTEIKINSGFGNID